MNAALVPIFAVGILQSILELDARFARVTEQLTGTVVHANSNLEDRMYSQVDETSFTVEENQQIMTSLAVLQVELFLAVGTMGWSCKHVFSKSSRLVGTAQQYAVPNFFAEDHREALCPLGVDVFFAHK